MKYILALAFLGCINSRTTQRIEDKELLQEIIESQPKLNFSVNKIPKKVKAKFKEKFNVPLNLSNPGSDYNKTDVVYKNEPIGMLLFSGKAANNLGFILFEVKGVTSQCYFTYYRIKRNNVMQMESLILKKQPGSFEDLKQLIINKEFL
ncbi:MAG: hypothetical protein N2747_10040 [Chitinophagaceae bacterium]|nr:hypothetical protein [Chitinophagaceae bacterium]